MGTVGRRRKMPHTKRQIPATKFGDRKDQFIFYGSTILTESHLLTGRVWHGGVVEEGKSRGQKLKS